MADTILLCVTHCTKSLKTSSAARFGLIRKKERVVIDGSPIFLAAPFQDNIDTLSFPRKRESRSIYFKVVSVVRITTGNGCY